LIMVDPKRKSISEKATQPGAEWEKLSFGERKGTGHGANDAQAKKKKRGFCKQKKEPFRLGRGGEQRGTMMVRKGFATWFSLKEKKKKRF